MEKVSAKVKLIDDEREVFMESWRSASQAAAVAKKEKKKAETKVARLKKHLAAAETEVDEAAATLLEANNKIDQLAEEEEAVMKERDIEAYETKLERRIEKIDAKIQELVSNSSPSSYLLMLTITRRSKISPIGFPGPPKNLSNARRTATLTMTYSKKTIMFRS